MLERVLVRTAAENATEAAGRSLSDSLHRIPVTIGLSGPVGAGKTAFMRGFLRGMCHEGPVASPTHALEHRYATPRGEVVHVDLYRLERGDALRLLRESDDHDGVRCVEWPENAGGALRADIRVTIGELSERERSIAIECDDVDWPEDATIDAWRGAVRLPPNVAAHCDAVGDFCARTADWYADRGIMVRRQFLRAAGKTHDMLRFVDFTPGAAPAGHVDPAEDVAVWTAWKAAHPDCRTHEEAARAFLAEHGYEALARVVPEHSIHLSPDKRTSIESRLLFYADKRVIGDRIVPLQERFDDFRTRYRDGIRTPESDRWEREAVETERSLFPDGPPF